VHGRWRPVRTTLSRRPRSPGEAPSVQGRLLTVRRVRPDDASAFDLLASVSSAPRPRSTATDGTGLDATGRDPGSTCGRSNPRIVGPVGPHPGTDRTDGPRVYGPQGGGAVTEDSIGMPRGSTQRLLTSPVRRRRVREHRRAPRRGEDTHSKSETHTRSIRTSELEFGRRLPSTETQ
jgi:hypothetical protein